MKIAGMIVAATVASGIAGTPALAQQTQTGMVTRIDRISGTVSIKPIQEGTVGAATDNAAEEFKMKDAARLNDLHAGNRVSYSVSDAPGARTIVKIDKK
ncbi:MAG: copper-binding protein [bacterium]|nr:copper-binding protein [bacterium]